MENVLLPVLPQEKNRQRNAPEKGLQLVLIPSAWLIKPIVFPVNCPLANASALP